MGDMADFVNDGIQDEIEFEDDALTVGDLNSLYEMGSIDEFGFVAQPHQSKDRIRPDDHRTKT